MDTESSILANLVGDTDGIVRSADRRLAVGAVLIAENEEDEILLVTKASKPGYEFGRLDVLPGGLLRFPIPGPISRDHVSRIALASITSRVQAEAGYLGDLSAERLSLAPVPTTSYFDRGRQQYVLVLPYVSSKLLRFVPNPSDSSVIAARWSNPILGFTKLAPANRVIVAFFIWPRLDLTARAACRLAVDEAIADTSEWARQVDVEPVSANWLNR